MSGSELFDVLIVGGGINGCGIARDAAGRGYKVALAEMNDLASGTSSGATKLIHGGLRYLEHYEFRLVREALIERERLWAIAPHIVWPLRFVLPIHKGLRPAWLLRLGLFIYDHLGGRKLLPPATTLDMRTDPVAKPLKPLYTRAFEYSDGWVNDARMVVLNAMDAKNHGANIMTRTKVIGAKRINHPEHGNIWEIELQPSGKTSFTMLSKLLVNVAGPWVDKVLADAVHDDDGKRIRLVKGSHIVVKSLFDHTKCYIFQNADGRIIFAIPYEEEFTLIGTTDQDYDGDPSDVKISEIETSYLCEAASEYFAKPISTDQVVWSYSAVRPLMDDGASKAQEATREYVITVQNQTGASNINVYGGKLTTYRKLAESVLEKIGEELDVRGKSWTANEALPGGDFPVTGFEQQLQKFKKQFKFLDARHAQRMVRLYGTTAFEIFAGTGKISDLGQLFGDDLYEIEVNHLIKNEWAVTSEDILWRRTKRGLWLDKAQVSSLDKFLATSV